MTIKNTLVATSFLLTMGATLPGFAETKAEDAIAPVCITAEEVAALSDEDKAEVTLPVCEEGQNADGTKATQ